MEEGTGLTCPCGVRADERGVRAQRRGPRRPRRRLVPDISAAQVQKRLSGGGVRNKAGPQRLSSFCLRVCCVHMAYYARVQWLWPSVRVCYGACAVRPRVCYALGGGRVRGSGAQRVASPSSVLCACYAMSGTDLGHAATSRFIDLGGWTEALQVCARRHC
eukprot:1444249-Rhodomonas_salina.1